MPCTLPSRTWLAPPTLSLLVALSSLGCADAPRGGEMPPNIIDPPPAADRDAVAATPADGSIATAPDAMAPSLPDAGSMMPPPPLGTLRGAVTRSTEPRAGGVGSVYVAVFEDDPVLRRDTARRVSEIVIDSADFSSPGARYTYEISDIPPRSEPYYIIAFLDDNATVDMSTPALAGPDRGDLISLEGLSAPTVVIPSATPVTVDLDLNFSLPF